MVNALRVLVADGCADSAESLTLLLGLWGHEAFAAADGLDALTLARDRRPNIVFTEIRLPKLDGYELARRLRVESPHSEVFLAAVTGLGREVDRRRSREAGFDCHLVKPVDPELLHGLVERLRPTSRTGRHRNAISQAEQMPAPCRIARLTDTDWTPPNRRQARDCLALLRT